MAARFGVLQLTLLFCRLAVHGMAARFGVLKLGVVRDGGGGSHFVECSGALEQERVPCPFPPFQSSPIEGS
jgi:hypothetical protein